MVVAPKIPIEKSSLLPQVDHILLLQSKTSFSPYTISLKGGTTLINNLRVYIGFTKQKIIVTFEKMHRIRIITKGINDFYSDFFTDDLVNKRWIKINQPAFPPVVSVVFLPLYSNILFFTLSQLSFTLIGLRSYSACSKLTLVFCIKNNLLKNQAKRDTIF